MPSNFDSPTPGSATWRSRGSSCASTGISVLANAQQAILYELPDVQLTVINPSDSSSDGWDANTLNALAALLDRYGKSSDAAAVRQNLASGGQISLQTMRAMLWAANSTGVRTTTHPDGTVSNDPVHLGAPSDYTIDADAVMPVVGSIPTAPLNAVVGDLPSCAPGDILPGVTAPTTTISTRPVNPLLVFAMLGAAAVTGVILFEAARGDQKW